MQLIFKFVHNDKKSEDLSVFGLFVVGEDGFEPSKRNAADLQSVPFGHSGTPPCSVVNCLLKQNLVIITRKKKMSRGF